MNPGRLNIVLYVNSFLPSLGGREFVIHYLAEALLTLGHHVRVMGPAGFWRYRALKFSYPVHRWPTSRGVLSDQVAMIQLLLDTTLWGCDVIHAHNTWPTGFIAARMRSIRRLPLVITPHGEDIQTIPEIGYGLMLRPELRKKIVYALNEAERVTAISYKIRDVVIEAGVHAEKLRLVPNGVDTKRFGGAPAHDVHGWLGIEPQSRLIVTIGRYNPRKGQEYLIRAMPEILAHEPRVRAVIVGEGTDVLEPLIGELGLHGKVVLTGGINPSQGILNRAAATPAATQAPDRLADLLRASDLYVSAGTDDNSEGLSLAVLEAMGAGLPVVATDISGNKDVVTNGENGYLVRPSDERDLARGVLQVLTQRPLQERMRAGARHVAGRYDWLNIARQYVDVYREAMDAAKRGA